MDNNYAHRLRDRQEVHDGQQARNRAPEVRHAQRRSSLLHHSEMRVRVHRKNQEGQAQTTKRIWIIHPPTVWQVWNYTTQVNLYFLPQIEQQIFLVNHNIVISSNIPSEARM